MGTPFYGKRIGPATREVARAFGVDAPPWRLRGGQGTVFVAGNVVLKPAESTAAATWMAGVFAELPESPAVRFARPVRSQQNSWVHEGYVAWTLVQGQHGRGNYDRKLPASRAFHTLLKGLEKPSFLDVPTSSWAAADLVATGQRCFDYEDEFMQLYEQIAPQLKPLDDAWQLIHGDLAGNFLLDPTMPPAIIDFSPAWGPAGLAEGIMLADAIVWEDASLEELHCWKSQSNIDQLALRGVVRRIAEQAEHIRFLGKSKTEAVQDARRFQKAIDTIGRLFG